MLTTTFLGSASVCPRAKEAGLTDRVWTFEDIANMIDETAEKPGKGGPYKKRIA